MEFELPLARGTGSQFSRAHANLSFTLKPPGVVSPQQTTPSRPTVFELANLRRPKKIRFFRNGDPYFQGIVLPLLMDHFRSLEGLFDRLNTTPLCDSSHLPGGVRHLFSLDGSRKITSPRELEDGKDYVCSSSPAYRKAEYLRSGVLLKNAGRGSSCHVSSRVSASPTFIFTDERKDDADRIYIQPRIVSVLKCGAKPRKCFRMLLNQRTVHNMRQVFEDVTDLLNLDCGKVKKMYTISGKQVTSLRDFFGEENVFLACGAEKPTAQDFELCVNEQQQLNFFNRSAPRTHRSNPHQLQHSSSRLCRTPKRMLSAVSARSLVQDRTGISSEMLSSPPHDRNSSLIASNRKQSLRTPSPTLIGIIHTPQSKEQVSHRLEPGLSTRQANPVQVVDFEPKQLRVKYKIGRVIGRGNFAIVKECVEKARKLPFALKILNKIKCQGREVMLNNEVSILRRIKHPNIVQLVDEFYTKNSVFLVMELVTGGDLFDSIAAATKYSERDASGMAYHIANAIAYLHSLNIVHRDIKPENLLVHERSDGFKSLKLGDFGLAIEVREPLFTVCGTPTYVAPEVLTEVGYGLKVDVWAVGVIIYILLCGFPPFSSENNNTEELFDEIQTGNFEFLSPYWDNISTSAKELIINLLRVDVDERFTAEQLVNYPWVAEDVAWDDDIHSSVCTRLIKFAKSERNQKYDELSDSRVAVIATTALDKGDRYFHPRRKISSPTPNRQKNGDKASRSS